MLLGSRRHTIFWSQRIWRMEPKNVRSVTYCIAAWACANAVHVPCLGIAGN